MAETIAEALDRARCHARDASKEGIRALRALVEATEIAAGSGLERSGLSNEERPTGEPHSVAGFVHDLKTFLDESIAALDEGRAIAFPEVVAMPLRETLDREIGRWETRSEHDDTARTVLRTLLALREFLWDFGLRPPTNRPDDRQATRSEPVDAPDDGEKTQESTGPRQRVQRFHIEGE